MNINELIEREYTQGTHVTNCLVHASMDLDRRPDDCKLCLTDLRNAFIRAISVNQWLNRWKHDATVALKAMR